MMKSHEAMNLSIHGLTRDVAKRLGLHMSTVQKWQEPNDDFTDSGAYNPLDRIESIIRFSLDQGRATRSEALMPITWLASQFNLALIDLPPVGGTLDQQSKALVAAIKEIGEWSAATARAIEDGRITRAEMKEIRREGMEAVSQVMACLFIAERDHKEAQGK